MSTTTEDDEYEFVIPEGEFAGEGVTSIIVDDDLCLKMIWLLDNEFEDGALTSEITEELGEGANIDRVNYRINQKLTVQDVVDIEYKETNKSGYPIKKIELTEFGEQLVNHGLVDDVTEDDILESKFSIEEFQEMEELVKSYEEELQREKEKVNQLEDRVEQLESIGEDVNELRSRIGVLETKAEKIEDVLKNRVQITFQEIDDEIARLFDHLGLNR